MKKKTILVVDDEILLLDAITFYLTMEFKNYNILSFSQSVEVLNYMDNNEVDMIILDVYLNSENGFDLYQKIKSRSKSVGIVYFSSSLEKTLYKAAFNLGADGFIYKTFNNKTKLIECINTVMKSGKYFEETIKGIKKGIQVKPIQKLTYTEKIIYFKLKEGKSIDLISNECFISTETVRNHRKSIYKKLKIHSISQLILYEI